MDLKEENQGKINDFLDRDFFIPPLIEHTNSSYANLEKFVTLVETIKWNPLTWDFFHRFESYFKSRFKYWCWFINNFYNGFFGLFQC